MSELATLEQRALEELTGCADEAGLRAWHTRYFGKQGEVTAGASRRSASVAGQRKALRPAGQPGQEGRPDQSAYEAAAGPAEKERALELQPEPPTRWT